MANSKIILYEHVEYNVPYSSGWEEAYTESVPHLEDKAAGASSLVIEHGAWVLHIGDNYYEPGRVLYPGHYPEIEHMGIPHDSLHSIRKLPDTGIVLFAGPYFQGEMIHIDEGQERAIDLHAMSVIVRTGEWQLFQHPDYQGDSADAKIGEYGTLPSQLHSTEVQSIRPSAKGNLLLVGSLQATSSGSNGAGGAQRYDLDDRPSVELIVDASGSMKTEMTYQGDNSTRMAVAKVVLKDVISQDLPDDIPVALRVFGPDNLHGEVTRSGGGVSTLVQPLQALDRVVLDGKIDEIQPDGKTPIAASIDKVRDDMENAPGSKLVVLVTDGDETCGGNVLQTIQQIRSDGFEIVLNIVGFAIDNDALKQQFTDWATAGNGKYYDATDADELHKLTKEALSVRYKVWKGRQVVASDCYVDGEAVELDPGFVYDVQLLPGDANFIENVRINAGRTTEILVNRG